MYVYNILVNVSLLKKFAGVYQRIKVIPNKIFFEICKKNEKNQIKYPRCRTLQKNENRIYWSNSKKKIEEQIQQFYGN